MDADSALLDRYHRDGDPAAFQALVGAHAAMVFACARRVTQDAALAEEVAQDTFVALARRAGAIRSNVAAWLYQVARQKACNALRGERRHQRRVHQAAVAPELEPGRREEMPWAAVEPVLDECLAQLPEAARALLIEHFLEERGQREIAARLGVSQATLSRQISAAVDELRACLRHRGVLCGAGLAALLGSSAACAQVPPSLAASLGKLSLAGLRSSASTPGLATACAIMTMTTKLVLSGLVLATAALAWSWGRTPPPAASPVGAASSQAALPVGAPVRSIAKSAPGAPAAATLDDLWKEAEELPDDRALMLAEFQRLGGALKEDVVEADLASIVRNHFRGDRQAFERHLASRGQSYDQFRTSRREEMIIAVLKARAAKGADDPAEKQDAINSWLAGLRRRATQR